MHETSIEDRLRNRSVKSVVSTTMAKLQLPRGPLGGGLASHGPLSAGPFLSARYQNVVDAGLTELTFGELRDKSERLYMQLMQGFAYVHDKTGINP